MVDDSSIVFLCMHLIRLSYEGPASLVGLQLSKYRIVWHCTRAQDTPTGKFIIGIDEG